VGHFPDLCGVRRSLTLRARTVENYAISEEADEIWLTAWSENVRSASYEHARVNPQDAPASVEIVSKGSEWPTVRQRPGDVSALRCTITFKRGAPVSRYMLTSTR